MQYGSTRTQNLSGRAGWRSIAHAAFKDAASLPVACTFHPLSSSVPHFTQLHKCILNTHPQQKGRACRQIPHNILPHKPELRTHSQQQEIPLCKQEPQPSVIIQQATPLPPNLEITPPNHHHHLDNSTAAGVTSLPAAGEQRPTPDRRSRCGVTPPLPATHMHPPQTAKPHFLLQGCSDKIACAHFPLCTQPEQQCTYTMIVIQTDGTQRIPTCLCSKERHTNTNKHALECNHPPPL